MTIFVDHGRGAMWATELGAEARYWLGTREQSLKAPSMTALEDAVSDHIAGVMVRDELLDAQLDDLCDDMGLSKSGVKLERRTRILAHIGREGLL